jgi:hypothetical protein
VKSIRQPIPENPGAGNDPNFYFEGLDVSSQADFCLVLYAYTASGRRWYRNFTNLPCQRLEHHKEEALGPRSRKSLRRSIMVHFFMTNWPKRRNDVAKVAVQRQQVITTFRLTDIGAQQNIDITLRHKP